MRTVVRVILFWLWLRIGLRLSVLLSAHHSLHHHPLHHRAVAFPEAAAFFIVRIGALTSLAIDLWVSRQYRSPHDLLRAT